MPIMITKRYKRPEMLHSWKTSAQHYLFLILVLGHTVLLARLARPVLVIIVSMPFLIDFENEQTQHNSRLILMPIRFFT